MNQPERNHPPLSNPLHAGAPLRPRFQTGQAARTDPVGEDPINVLSRREIRQYEQTKIHGAKAALTFVGDETRANEPTVTIEAASRAEGTVRSYAWTDKLRFQLTGTELQLLTCLLLGAVGELSFRNHGEKWCSVIRQTAGHYAGTIRLTMGQGEAAQFAPRTVALDFATIGPVLALCLRQCAQLLRTPIGAVPTVLRPVAKAYCEQTQDKSRPRTSAEDNAATHK
jgi:hypothetical protein